MKRRELSSQFWYGTILLVGYLVAACNQPENKSSEGTPLPLPRKAPVIARKDELYVFLDSLEARYERACITMGTARWESLSTGTAENRGTARQAFVDIFTDTNARSIIDEWRQKSSSLADKPLARRLELWHRCFLGGSTYIDSQLFSLESSLEARINRFTFSLNGIPVPRSKLNLLLRDEKNEARRHAIWSAPSQLATMVKDDFIHLLRLRNQRARLLGYSNYYSLRLGLDAIDEAWLLKTFNSLEKETRGEFERFVGAAERKLHNGHLHPWDFDFVLRAGAATPFPSRSSETDSVLAIVRRFEQKIGFGIDTLPITETVGNIAAGGVSLAIVIPSDCRILISSGKDRSVWSSALRAYGHSLQATLTQVDYPILKGYEWIPGTQCIAYDEGVAEMHAEFSTDSSWLATFVGAKPRQIERYTKYQKLASLYRLRLLLKDFTIEHELYADPDQDVGQVERGAFKRYLLTELDSTEAPQAAASICFTSAPCYSQNCILAAMAAAQLQEAIDNEFGEKKFQDSALAGWITEHLYASGEREEWTERIRNATGKSLEPGGYLRKLGIEPMRPIISNDQ